MEQFLQFLVLDALGDDPQTQFPAENDDRAGDARTVVVAFQGADEAAVDLETIGRQLVEVGQGRVAGTEVVDGHRDSHGTQAFEQGNDGFEAADCNRFGDFQFQIGGSAPGQTQGTR
jgi:hypothetical protein